MIFVMAATGEVGRATVHELVRQGLIPSRIVAGGRTPAKLSELGELGVQVRQADYTDAGSMDSAFQGVETLILIPSKSEAAPRCQEHQNALHAAKKVGVKRVIFLSIQAAKPDSLFGVAPFILFAESATRLSGMEWTIARMSLYTDPLAEWAPELARTGLLPYPVVQARIAYVSRADIARSLAALARSNEYGGQILELTGPAAVSMPELAQAISRATDATVAFQTITEERYRDLCREQNEPEGIIGILVTMYRAAEAQEFSHVSADIERLTGAPPERISDALARLLKK